MNPIILQDRTDHLVAVCPKCLDHNAMMKVQKVEELRNETEHESYHEVRLLFKCPECGTQCSSTLIGNPCAEFGIPIRFWSWLAIPVDLINQIVKRVNQSA